MHLTNVDGIIEDLCYLPINSLYFVHDFLVKLTSYRPDKLAILLCMNISLLFVYIWPKMQEMSIQRGGVFGLNKSRQNCKKRIRGIWGFIPWISLTIFGDNTF